MVGAETRARLSQRVRGVLIMWALTGCRAPISMLIGALQPVSFGG